MKFIEVETIDDGIQTVINLENVTMYQNGTYSTLIKLIDGTTIHTKNSVGNQLKKYIKSIGGDIAKLGE